MILTPWHREIDRGSSEHSDRDLLTVVSPEGAAHLSPGHRPGYPVEEREPRRRFGGSLENLQDYRRTLQRT